MNFQKVLSLKIAVVENMIHTIRPVYAESVLKKNYIWDSKGKLLFLLLYTKLNIHMAI